MNKLSLIALLGATAIGLAGCGTHSSTTNTTTTTTTSNTAAPAAPAGGSSNSAAPAGGDTATGGSESGGGSGSEQHNQNFTLINHSGHTLVTLNVSPSDSSQWGPDILGRDTLANGESADITFPRGTEQCNWDIKATYDDNDTTDQRGVNLCTTTSVEITGG